MIDFDNTNKGVLFKNDKEGVEGRPDYKGKLDVNGEEMQIAGWIRKSKKGVSFMSLSVHPEPKNTHTTRPEPNRAPTRQASPQPSQDDFDDDIPF